MALIVRNMSVKAGEKLKITGRPTDDAKNFAINLGCCGKDITLRFRGKDNCMLTITKPTESTILKPTEVSIQQGKDFEIYISFNNCAIQNLTISGKTVEFYHCLKGDKLAFIEVLGDVRIKGFNIEV